MQVLGGRKRDEQDSKKMPSFDTSLPVRYEKGWGKVLTMMPEQKTADKSMTKFKLD